MYVYLPPEYIQHLEERLQKLEKDNEELKQKLENIKPVHIENINYKIQELVVQELSGTLNIGLTAEADAEEIQRWFNGDGKEGVQINDLEENQSQAANNKQTE
ncbi:hypothetical protein CathTA2_1739 [Caldalkalibacillus thermarum TA2.A1]|uniref:Spore germination protein GerPC n=1 Tax=Caldalkalibacillus thermarum (strain TA2.A1) TaxID=986075 RepID=F5L7D9_CALTT|nr:spore germination protein GerPC [Caldalkalibacillus thermarum]EGL82731.1 hypothetical protein CathTA2_1739 [Caldalkalibacillus thermarum TA2.A1]QZT32569.1 spore germination protein GerPC [Caldalkalibacillus thermarum TA2.A1]